MKKWLWIAAGVHLLTAIFSVGYHHFDEHFQILEFMNYKLGGTPESALTWEYPARLRPWLMPWFFYGIAKAASIVGVSSPFTLALIFRIISSAIAFLATLLLLKAVQQRVKLQDSFWLVFLLFFTFFIPYLHVRTSSETYSASFFVMGLSVLFLAQPRLSFASGEGKLPLPDLVVVLSGLLLAISFACRFQMGISIFFFFVWMLFSRQFENRSLLLFIVSLLVGIYLSCLLDQFSYGEMTWTPWNYLRINLFEGKAAEFSVSPFWYYLMKPMKRGAPPLSTILLVGTLIFWLRNPKNVWVWVTLPFCIVHSAIGHKEVRFLQFVYALSPLFLFFSFEHYFRDKELLKKGWVKFLVGVNCILLLGLTFRASKSEMSFYEAVAKHKPQKVYLLDASTPFIPRRHHYFYVPYLPMTEKIESVEQLNAKSFVYADKYKVLVQLPNEKNCKYKYSSVPKFVIGADMFKPFAKNTWTAGLFECGL